MLSSARPFVLEVDGRRLAAWRWGAGPAVLLVHGWEGRGAQLGALVRPLVDRGLSVVTFDAPGHGDSPGERLVIADMARAIGAAARAILDGTADGVSAGGDSIGHRTRKAADTAGTARELRGIVAHSFGAAATTLALAQGLIPQDDDRPRVVYLAPAALVTGATSRFADLVGLSLAGRRRLERRLEQLNGFTVEQADAGNLAGGLTAPLLVIHDADDDEVPLTEGVRIADAWPRALLRITSGLGHRNVLWHPSVIEHAVGFLSAPSLRFADDAVARAPLAEAAPPPAAPLTDAGAHRAFVDAWVEAVPAPLARRP